MSYSEGETLVRELSRQKNRDRPTDSAHSPRATCKKTVRPSSIPSSHHRAPLTGLGSNLDRCTLSTLLAGDTASGTSLGSTGELGLLGLLGGSGLLLLVLAVLDGSETGGAAGLRAHGAALLDHIEGSTNDSTLGLDGATSALLGDFL